ncbi:hypothetical protein GCM10009602_65360 [Nocardiopsis tropica]
MAGGQPPLQLGDPAHQPLVLTARDHVHPLQLAPDLRTDQVGEGRPVRLAGLDELARQRLDALPHPRRRGVALSRPGEGGASGAVRPQQGLGGGDGLLAREFGEAIGGIEIGAYRVDDHDSGAP